MNPKYWYGYESPVYPVPSYLTPDTEILVLKETQDIVYLGPD